MDLITLASKPFVMLLCGRPGSGKSHFIKWFIYSMTTMRRPAFNHIILISGTALTDQYNYIPNRYKYEKMSDELLEGIIEFQKRTQVPGLLVIDDPLAFAEALRSKSFEKLISIHRHLKLSIIIATQYVFKIPPSVREACGFSAIWDGDTKRSLNALFETFGMTTFNNLNEFIAAVKEGCYDHSFLWYDRDLSGEENFQSLKVPGPETINHFVLHY